MIENSRSGGIFFTSIFVAMNILLTGANGFLGYYLTQQLLNKGHTVIATAKGARLPYFNTAPGYRYYQLDIADPAAITAILSATQPNLVIHAGAMSKPDVCETERELAWNTNVIATRHLAAASAAFKSHFIFLSSDFVFSGEKDTYAEEDATGPVNYYGVTKAAAEVEVRQYPFDWSIIRTVLVYGHPVTGKGNIITVVREKLETGQGYSVFGDQLRTPTYVEDLASGIVSIVQKRATGIYHLSGTDRLSPYDIAVRTAQFLHLDGSLLKKVEAHEFSQSARRPPKTCFDISKARRDLGYAPLLFEEGLQKTFRQREA